ncbi:transporter substrate-binding domain-containing protein, partial [Streptomyces tendae]
MTARSICRQTAAKSAKSRIAVVGTIAVVGSLLLSGCGDQTNDKESDTVSNAPLADKLPKDIRDKGVIKVGSDIAYPPVEFKDKSGNTVGIDPDLGEALGKQLGVKFEFENGTFDTLLGGLRSKRYQIAMSAMTDTKNRQEGIDEETGKKVGDGVDFVDYFTAGV